MAKKGPSFPSRTQLEKKAWKKKLEENQGGDTFEYTQEGWFAVSQLHASDTVTISLRIRDTGELECAEESCVKRGCHQFGKTANTRGEYNVDKHCSSFHVPAKKTRDGGSIGGSSRTSASKPGRLDSYFFKQKPTKSVGKKRKQPDSSSCSGLTDSSKDEKMPASAEVALKSNTPSPSKDALLKSNQEEVVSVLSSAGSGEAKMETDASSMSIPSTSSFSAESARLLTTGSDGSPSSLSGCTADESESLARSPTLGTVLTSTLPLWMQSIVKHLPDGTIFAVCPGADVSLPSPPYMNYPMTIERVVPGVSARFLFDSELKGVRASECNKLRPLVHSSNSSSSSSVAATSVQVIRCDDCKSVSGDSLLRAIVQRAYDVDIHTGTTNNDYLTESQKDLRLKHRRGQIDEAKLSALNNDRRLAVVCRHRDQQKQLVSTIAQDDIKRSKAILARAAREGRGANGVLQMLVDARDGKYHPKGYSPRELDEGILLWKLGGHALVYAENHSHIKGSPSLRVIQRRGHIPVYIPMYCDIVDATVKSNYERFLFDPRMQSRDKRKCSDGAEQADRHRDLENGPIFKQSQIWD